MGIATILLALLTTMGVDAAPGPDTAVHSWAKENGYKIVHHEKGNVWFFLPWSDDKTTERKLSLITKTLEAVEPYLPGVAGEVSLPPVHVLQLRAMADSGSLRRLLAEQHAYFDPSESSDLVGFVCGEPVLGAWVSKVPGQEEWNPENELVNRLAQLLVMRRLGRLPYWLEMGLAWNVEMNVLGAVYCFPWRAEFVWASEHKGWHRRVKQLMSKRKMKILDFGLLAEWKRDTFDADASLVAWDVVRYLLDEHTETLPTMLREMARLHEKNRWVKNEDGSETTRLDYVLPASEQIGVLEQGTGDAFLKSATDWIRKQKK